MASGNVCLGTISPAARLDVSGRIMRNGQDFTQAGTISHGGFVVVPWGTTNDWNIFVSPREMGIEEPFSEGDNAMLYVRCYASVFSSVSWVVLAEFKFKESNSAPNGFWAPGTANWLLVPR